MIELAGIEKHFVIGGGTLGVIRGIDLFIGKGEFVAIMGPSGSGKSTLLNIIGCLDTASAGSYRLSGDDVSAMDDRELAAIRNRRIGFIFQSFNLIARNSALKNIEKPLIYQGAGAAERSARAASMLERVGLSNRASHLPSQLSGGQQQRVAIARALVTNPDILIADEPTGNLDSATGRDIMGLLREVSGEGRTVVMVTHDPALAAHADRTIHLADGKVAA
ncbi:ABC transporter ATP-binding protein [Massilia sp. TSP1-1-2]|uniref:ABC transporter ATP-binding protein n=1 Tax=unclassified Massilia TaxID=2609279 RepID=UPI003CF69DC2